jgi:hypothetical protein
MFIDLRLGRRLMAWGLGIAAMTPFLFCREAPAEQLDLYPVSGRVTYAGQPVSSMFICLDTEGSHSAQGSLRADGSFQLVNFQHYKLGTFPGRYHAHLTSLTDAPVVPAKYQDSRTSGLEVDVASDWNYLEIDLQ